MGACVCVMVSVGLTLWEEVCLVLCTHVPTYTRIRAHRSGEPMDKAGSYGIQGLGGQMVQSVDGWCVGLSSAACSHGW